MLYYVSFFSVFAKMETPCKQCVDDVDDHNASVCTFYLYGSCRKGADCAFLHARKICTFHLAGKCNKTGDECRFSHTMPPCPHQKAPLHPAALPVPLPAPCPLPPAAAAAATSLSASAQEFRPEFRPLSAHANEHFDAFWSHEEDEEEHDDYQVAFLAECTRDADALASLLLSEPQYASYTINDLNAKAFFNPSARADEQRDPEEWVPEEEDALEDAVASCVAKLKAYTRLLLTDPKHKGCTSQDLIAKAHKVPTQLPGED